MIRIATRNVLQLLLGRVLEEKGNTWLDGVREREEGTVDE